MVAVSRPFDVARLRVGDPDEWERVVSAVGERLDGYLFRYGVPDRGAVVGETWRRAFLGIGRFRDDGCSVLTWIFSIARNAALDALREGRRKGLHEPLHLRGRADPRTPAPIEGLDLEDALSLVGRRRRLVARLRWEKGYGYEEIARLLCVPLGTVKSMLFRARTELEPYFKE